MSSLLDIHEEILGISLEDPDYFGHPFTFSTSDGVTVYDPVFGSHNVISKHLETGLDGVTARRANCTVRFSTLAARAGYPDNVNWQDGIPGAGWVVDTVLGKQKIPVKYLIEKGSEFPDDHQQIVTFFLTKLTVTP